jgi:hypothetical protein
MLYASRRFRFVLVLLLGASVPSIAYGDDGKLQDFISDLYGGDGILLPSTGPSPFAPFHVAHFTGASIEELSRLNTGIVNQTGFFAFNSTVTGLTFDIAQGVPVAVEDSLGPLLAERATTIGQGRLAISFGYSHVHFDELDGDDLGEIQVVLPHADCCNTPGGPPPDGDIDGFELDRIDVAVDIDLEEDVYAFFVNYGLTDRWDVGVVVPYVNVDAKADAHATVDIESGITNPPIHSFANDPSLASSSTGGEESGIGDAILRSKYHFWGAGDGSGLDLAVLGQVTFSTGEEEDLLGTGATKYLAMFVASERFGNTTPHVNVGYEVTSGDADLENLRYAVGIDQRFSQSFTGGIDIIGRYYDALEEIGNNPIDGSVSVKWNPFERMNMPLNAYVIFPLNDDGLRSDLIWGIGFDIIW